MTPVALSVILHYHYQTCPHPEYGSKSVNSTIKAFVADGILMIIGEDEFRTTERGSVFVEMLCDTPFPIESWKDPRV
jgi:hypothetical protein